MKQLFDPLFTGYCLVWLAVHYCRQKGIILPFINGQLTDFVAVPAIAHLTLTITRQYIIRQPAYRYPLVYLLFIALYTTLLLEVIMPGFSRRYTADLLDAAAYLSGGLFYYFVHQRLHSI
ncbi:hypothetical protein SAMN05444266_101293 [Chitinophaga jiangningensis]|uniref:Magnesium citrate secondary transporter n=1 Tax=Chitinophaga jiangningensis TaxID=1419482 RepID=A0A1M6VPA9_9BACT|nr:hypothetical protein [Chitinophaga jiangningensis]SHK83175.1 hypothetical protein SAMN05444266_101293 [Chitinophaga jiangningensis]